MINKAVELKNNMSIYYGEQSKIYNAIDKYDDALIAANKALSLDPQNPDGYLFKSAAYYNKENFNEAVKVATEGIANLPNYYLLYSMRAAYYRALKNNTLADADEAKAKQLASK